MHLEKWYLDAVFADGTVWYGYHARLKLAWCPSIQWAAGRTVLPDGSSHEIASWRRWGEPCRIAGEWEWTGPDGFKARWHSQVAEFKSQLADQDPLRISWKCLAPHARVVCERGSSSMANSHSPAATSGYLEHLTLHAPGRTLPFKRLSWGRAHAGKASVVWIRWDEGRDLSLIVENGSQVAGEVQTLDHGGILVRTLNGEWLTGASQTLCDRHLGGSFPRWLVWLAGSMVPRRELKLTGPASFRNAQEVIPGSAIWEEVTWL